MQPTQELIDELFREEVEEARRMTPEQKLLAGEDLYRYAERITLAGIKHENPGIDNQRALEILQERFDLVERVEQRRGNRS